MRGLQTAAPRGTRIIPSQAPRTLRPISFTRNFSRFEPLRARYPRDRSHGRYDYSEVERAKPLIGDETLLSARSRVKWLVIFAAGGSLVFYYGNIEEVPVSKRRRFNIYSEETMEQEGQMAYQMIMNENRNHILPSWDRRTQMVQRVMRKLVPVSGLADANWEVHVIESHERNAFVLPGGKVFVYTGILDITRDDNGLAAVLGHEIAHNVARHSAESMSSMILLEPVRWGLIALDYLGYTGGLGRLFGYAFLHFGVMMPASRKQESEADYIGLLMMARACYDPKAAVHVWERMEIAMKEHDIPQWLSTHPSNTNRISQMQKWLPEAELVRDESECSVTMHSIQDFRGAFKDPWEMFR